MPPIFNERRNRILIRLRLRLLQQFLSPLRFREFIHDHPQYRRLVTRRLYRTAAPRSPYYITARSEFPDEISNSRNPFDDLTDSDSEEETDSAGQSSQEQ